MTIHAEWIDDFKRAEAVKARADETGDIRADETPSEWIARIRKARR